MTKKRRMMKPIIILKLIILQVALFRSNFAVSEVGRTCSSNSDCAEGSICVAADSVTSIQRCVNTPVCGGNTVGNCPSVPAENGSNESQPLICVWYSSNDTCAKSPDPALRCKEYNGVYGIFKCASLPRCDKQIGGSTCTDSCAYKGNSCNNRGTCQSTGPNTFNCNCDKGLTGDRCQDVVNGTCTVGVGNCGTFGTCVEGKCECRNNWTGVQCEVPPDTKSGSGSSSPGNRTGGSGSSVTDGESAGKKIASWLIAVIVISSLIFMAVLIFLIMRRRREVPPVEGDGEQGEYNDISMPRRSLTPKGAIATM